MKYGIRKLAISLAMACAAAAPAAAQQTTVVEGGDVVATVLDVDVDSRRALLKGENGVVWGVVVNEAAGGLENVKPGDLVQVVRVEFTALQMAKPGQVDEEAGMVIRGERDSLPARDDVTATRRVVEVLKVTRDGTEVTWRDATITGPGYVGGHVTVITDPDLKAFAQTLSVHDKVVVDTLEKVSISVVGE